MTGDWQSRILLLCTCHIPFIRCKMYKKTTKPIGVSTGSARRSASSNDRNRIGKVGAEASLDVSSKQVGDTATNRDQIVPGTTVGRAAIIAGEQDSELQKAVKQLENSAIQKY